jgi:hypothetical protein
MSTKHGMTPVHLHNAVDEEEGEGAQVIVPLLNKWTTHIGQPRVPIQPPVHTVAHGTK